MNEMFPNPTEFIQPQKQSAWLEKAKMSLQGEKKVEPFNFQAEVCHFAPFPVGRALLTLISS